MDMKILVVMICQDMFVANFPIFLEHQNTEIFAKNMNSLPNTRSNGNGYPVAAFGGRSDVMDAVGSNKGAVVHGGTYTANLVALSAAHETLNILTNTSALATVDRVGVQIQELLGRVFTKAGIEHAFAGPPAMFGIHFTPSVPTNYRDWRLTNSALYQKFAWKLIDLGVMLEPDSREPWFICEAHQQLDLDWLEDTAHKAMQAVL